MKVFFYGLFMDVDLLAKQGVVPERVSTGWVSDFALKISQRATLVRTAGRQAHGLVMDITSSELEALYSDASVADYVPETLIVNMRDGSSTEALCYNLPLNKIAGEKKEYAKLLLALAMKLGFPTSYTDQILRASQ